MDERSIQQRRTPRRRRKRLAFRLFLPIISIILVVVSVSLLWSTIFQTEGAADEPPAIGFPTHAGHPDTQEDTLPEETSQNPAELVDWNLVLVNKWNAIPEEWEMNLVELDGGERVDERIYEPLMEMLEAAREGNWDQLPMVVSGYRTAEKQKSIYDAKVKKYEQEGYSRSEAIELAEQWVALPGHSEHHLGFAVDINGATYDVYFWLQENSYKYGFIFRYPGSKTDITGVAEEVWHYRYVGVEVATEIYEQGICLEEYLENIGR